jgi:hypothetical protein
LILGREKDKGKGWVEAGGERVMRKTSVYTTSHKYTNSNSLFGSTVDSGHVL